MRFILDNKVDVANGAEPRSWIITKINRLQSNGMLLATLAQDEFNEHTDYIEYENPSDPSSIIGMWANYYSDSQSTPQDPTEPDEPIYSKITFTGPSPALKVGGSYKKYTVNFFNGDEPVPYKLGHWSFTLDGTDISSLLSYSEAVEENQVKVKFTGDDTYIGKTIICSFTTTSGSITSSIEVPIMGL